MTKINETFLAMEYSILELTHITKDNVEYEITAKHKIIYCYLCSLSRTFDTVYPSLEGIAKRLGFTSEQIVRREIKQLIKMGLVAKELKKGCTNRYTVFPITQDNPPESIHASPVEDVVTVPDAIPQVVIEEPAQSDTEAYSDNEECPFFTTSEQAFNNESEDESGVFSLPYAGSSKKKEVDLDAICNTLINCLDAGNRKSDEKFTPFAKRILEDLGITFPAGLEIYFSKTYPGIYEDLDSPF
ncbi:TPA: helix-turn-helix domain-containing protein [Klebsiella variicola]